MAKFRTKPVVIEAVVWNGKNFDEIMQFMGDDGGNKKAYEDEEEGCLETGQKNIRTLEGNMTANKGDYIIRGVQGEYYPCKPDIFEQSYEEVQ